MSKREKYKGYYAIELTKPTDSKKPYRLFSPDDRDLGTCTLDYLVEWEVAVYPKVNIVATVLPTDPAERKSIPVATGCLDYFPSALLEIAKISKKGNDQHNPGEPLHWARGKSMDHADTIIRHFMERGTVDVDGTRHSAKLAWRALALLQEELEQAGAPIARGAY